MNKIIMMIVLLVVSIQAGKNVKPAVSDVLPVSFASPFYIGAGLSYSWVSRDCPCAGAIRLKDSRFGPILRLGWDYNDYLGIEVRGIYTGANSVFSAVKHYGLYLKPQYSITDDINLYGLIGYGKSEVDYTNGIKSSVTDYTGFNYGIGIEYDIFNEKDNNGTIITESPWSIWADYQNLMSGEGLFNTDANILHTGIRYTF